MVDYSGALKKIRDEGYPKAQGNAPTEQPEAATPTARIIKLTDDEAKELQSYSEGEGTEQTCEVTGILDGNKLKVTSVRSPEGMEPDMDDMAEEAMGKSGIGATPMVQNQTLPSPS
jgi:hypothetical protein